MSEVPVVVICDDDDQRVGEWGDRVDEVLDGAMSVVALDPEQFAKAVAALKLRKMRGKAAPEAAQPDDADVFDEAAVVLLDSDLTPDPESPGWRSPEELIRTHLAGSMGGDVAHLVRTLTGAGAVGVINQYWKTRTFDLTMTKVAHEVADVYISEEDLDSPRLWGVEGDAGYKPWSWPRLICLPDLISAAADACNLDDPVLQSLDLSDSEILDRFYDPQLEVLGLDISPECTFRAAANSDELGLQRKEQTTEPILKRVAVSVVRRWLERLVLPSQNILIDMPHLMQHNPWLVPDRSNLSAWNASTEWWYGVDAVPSIATDAWNPAASALLGRNVWNVAQLPPAPTRDRVLASDPVFCEDSSTFVELSDATDFSSDIAGPFSQRFIQRVSGVEYSPRRRLVL